MTASTDGEAAPGALPGLVAFLPYLFVSAVHLVLIVGGFDAGAASTKLLLMPALALGVLLVLRPLASRTALLLLAGILCSWAGDTLLGFDGGLMFVVGLSCFLLAHLCYVALFVSLAGRVIRPPVWTLVYPLWFAALLVVLWADLGALTAPVAVYGLVLAAMAAFAARLSPTLAWGGALFVASDSLLALDRFAPGYGFALNGLAVMLSYTAAQGLIAWGVVLLAGRVSGRRPVTDAARGPAAAPTVG